MGFLDRFKRPKEKQATKAPPETEKHLRMEELTHPEKARPDWRTSKAHLLLLSKFVQARPSVDFIKYGDWENVLGESPQQTIEQFISDGALVYAEVSGLLSYRYKVTELKEMLRRRDLSVSGRKDEMIQRLVCSDSNGMKQAVAGLSLMLCSQQGKEMAEKYLAAEIDERFKAEKQVLAYLVKREFREASYAVADYRKEQVFTQGIGVDWKHYNPDKDIEILTAIFKGKPKLLTGLDEEKLQPLRMGAAMMQLWGENNASRWLPDNFETGLPFDNDVAARMMWYRAQNSSSKKVYYESGLVKYVEILASPDSCESCKKLANKRYKLNEVPELPNEECTYEMGCRCTLIPVVK